MGLYVIVFVYMYSLGALGWWRPNTQPGLFMCKHPCTPVDLCQQKYHVWHLLNQESTKFLIYMKRATTPTSPPTAAHKRARQESSSASTASAGAGAEEDEYPPCLPVREGWAEVPALLAAGSYKQCWAVSDDVVVLTTPCVKVKKVSIQGKVIPSYLPPPTVMTELSVWKALTEADLDCVTPLVDSGMCATGCHFYMVSRRMQGTLFTAVKRKRGNFENAMIPGIMGDLAAGLAAMHARNIIHRDMKPANILVGEIKGHHGCHIADFGTSRKMDDLAVFAGASHLASCTTACYLPPEGIHEAIIPYDSSVDVAALGMILFDLVTREYFSVGFLDVDLNNGKDRGAVNAGYATLIYRTLALGEAAGHAHVCKVAPPLTTCLCKARGCGGSAGIPAEVRAWAASTLALFVAAFPPGLGVTAASICAACVDPTPEARPTAASLLKDYPNIFFRPVT